MEKQVVNYLRNVQYGSLAKPLGNWSAWRDFVIWFCESEERMFPYLHIPVEQLHELIKYQFIMCRQHERNIKNPLT